MASNNYAFLSNGVLSIYTYENEGVFGAIDSVAVGNTGYDFNVSINTTSLTIQNTTVSFSLKSPTLAQKNTGTYYLNANGSWVIVSGGGGGGITEIQTSNGVGGGTITTTGNLYIIANTGTYVNSSGLFVNAAYINTISANSATYLGGNTAGSLKGYSDNAYSNAVSTASSDATTKAGTAYTNAVAYVDGKSYVNSAQLSANLVNYQTTAGLAANVATLDSATVGGNSAGTLRSYSDTMAATAYTNAVATASSDATSKVATAYTNSVAYVDGKSYVNSAQLSANLSNYQTTAGLAANVAILAANSATYVLANNGIVSNSSGVFVLVGTGTVVNSTGVHVNSAYIATLDSATVGGNSAGTLKSYSDTMAATAYTNAVSTASSDATTKAGTAYTNAVAYVDGKSYVNTAQLSANLVNYVQNTDSRVLSGNLNFTGTNTYFTSGLFVGANIVVNTSIMFIGNSTVNTVINSSALSIGAIYAAGSYGNSNQVLTTNSTAVYWANAAGGSSAFATEFRQQYTANGTQTDFTVTSGYVANQISVYLNGVLLRNGTDVTVTSGTTFTISPAPAANTLIDAIGQSILYANGISTIVSQQFTANGTANSFTISGGYLPNQVQVYLNGVKQLPTTDVIITSGNTVNFINMPANSASIDVYGYQTSVSYSTNNLIVGNVSIGTDLISIGNSTVNTTANSTVILLGNTNIGRSNITVGNSTVNTVISNGNLSISGSNISPVQSFRNKIINGNFDFWQRGTSTSTSGAYCADRWVTTSVGSTFTSSQQSFTLGQTDVPNEPRYWHRTAVTSSAGAGNYVIWEQRIESVRSCAGKTITISFWAKADASKSIALEFNQYFGTGGSPSATVTTIGVTTCALTTTWTKFTATVTIPSISGKTIGSNNNDYLSIYFWLNAGSTFNSRTNSLGQASGTYDFSQVQIEEGSVATPFEIRPIGLEFILCQRYYEVGVSTFSNPMWNGYAASGTAQYAPTIFRVIKRAIPSIVLTNTAASLFPASGTAAGIQIDGFYEQRTASSTGQAGYFSSTYTASAEL